MKVTIIGAGNMGRAIGTRAVAGGHDVEIIDRDPKEAEALASELGGSAKASEAVEGDVVALAMYYPDTLEAIKQYGDQMDGKVVVEISNPLDRETFSKLVTPPDSSAAEEAAKALPEGAKVVKAFNTTFANTLVEGEAHGQQLDVFMAGDDDDAKGKVKELVESAGLRVIDAGELNRARQLEQVGLLHITLQGPLGTGYASALKIHP